VLIEFRLGHLLGGAGLGALGGRRLRLGDLAVELLAKLPRLLGRQALEAAQEVVETAVCHSPERIVMS
jgi:hypothetical protein